MKLFIFSLVAVLSGFCLAASPWEVWHGPGDPVDPSWEVDGAPPAFVLIPNERVARRHAERTGAYVGRYPALLNVDTKFWVVVEDTFEAAVLGHQEHARVMAEVEFSQAQDTKPPPQKALENEYFALVESIYAAAGDPAPSLEEAKNLGQARAKIAKARQNKPGTGQGNKKTADDALEFLDMQLKLQGLDLELRGYDPDWRRLARKHELE